MQTLTQPRLIKALETVLRSKAPSLYLCIFIDGLDEISDNLDGVMDVVERLARDPKIKTCVSSRPEQIFKKQFKDTPQIQLHDINSEDIHQAAEHQLVERLRREFPAREWEIELFIQDITTAAQGVFLWAILVVKDIKEGIINKDRFEMLQKRLVDMPSELEALFKLMLERGNKKHYGPEAGTIFGCLLICTNKHFLSLLHVALLNDDVKDRVKNKDWAYFESAQFDEVCERLETRIRVCCADLVEVNKDKEDTLNGKASIINPFTPEG